MRQINPIQYGNKIITILGFPDIAKYNMVASSPAVIVYRNEVYNTY